MTTKEEIQWIGAAIVVAIVVFSVIGQAQKEKDEEQERKKRICNKYADSAVKHRLLNQEVWNGQTRQQLIDALGQPDEIQVKALKTKEKETFKYFRGNRCYLKVVIENDIVVQWELR